MADSWHLVPASSWTNLGYIAIALLLAWILYVNLVHGVPEGVWNGLQVDFPGICGRGLVPRQRNYRINLTGDETTVARIHGARIRVQSTVVVTPTPLGSYPDNEISDTCASMAIFNTTMADSWHLVPASSWTNLGYIAIALLLSWILYVGLRFLRVAFRVSGRIITTWNLMFGSHSTRFLPKNMRLHPYLCKTCTLDEVTVNELYLLVEEMVASETGCVQDFHRVMLSYSHVLMFREATDGSLRGMLLVGFDHKGAYTTMMVGLAFFRNYYRGGPLFYLIIAYLAVRELILHPRTPLYVTGKTFSYKSYLVAVRQKECYPIYNKATPQLYRDIITRFVEETKAPSERFNPETFVLEREKSHLKDSIAPITDKEMQNPHIKFFVESNPGWRKGHCLCVAYRLYWIDVILEVWGSFQKAKKGATGSESSKVTRAPGKSRPPLHKRTTFFEPAANGYAVDTYEMDCFGEVNQQGSENPYARRRIPSLDNQESQTEFNIDFSFA